MKKSPEANDSQEKVKISSQAKFCSSVFRLVNAKTRLEKTSRNPYRTRKGFVPRGIVRSFKAETHQVDNHTIATLESKTNVINTHVIFFHGGGYVFEALPFHWAFAKKLINKTLCRITVVDYPLSPEHTYKETFDMVLKTYNYLIDKYADDAIILMGDSAGGGLALGFTHKLIEEKHSRLPAKNILLSPALDLTVSNPDYKDLEDLDLLLSVKFLKYCASVYSGGDELNQYLLSPINGNFENHPETILFFGTHELFKADCMKLKSITEKINAPFTYFGYEGMPHDFVIMPIPERDSAIRTISDFIKY